MEIKVTIKEDYLKDFFKSLSSYSWRKIVQDILESSGLSWKSYWDIPQLTRQSFVRAFLWAIIYPSPLQLKKILLEEKLKGPTNLFLKWNSEVDNIVIETFELFSDEEYRKVYKRYEIQHLVKYSPKRKLMLLIGDPRWDKYLLVWGRANYNALKTLFEKRLKDE
jgi:hypothetical protein